MTPVNSEIQTPPEFYSKLKGESVENARVSFDWLFFKRSIKLLSVMFPSFRNSSFLLLILLLLVAALKEFIAYHVGLISSRYYSVLPDKNYLGFIQTTIFATSIIVLIALIMATISFFSNMLYIKLRDYVTTRLHELYYANSMFYYINYFSDIDNPDQRFTQDVERLSRLFTTILPVVILSPFTIAFYTYKTADSAGWLGPTSAYVFFFIFTIFNKCVLGWVSRSVFAQEQAEGNFRYKHVQLRVNAEEAAFHHAGQLEFSKTQTIFSSLLDIQSHLYLRQFLLDFITNSSDYLGSILTYVAVSFSVFAGSYKDKSSGEITIFISQTAFFLMYLVNKMTSLIDTAGSVAQIVGISQRISRLLEEMESSKSFVKPADIIASKMRLSQVYQSPEAGYCIPTVANNHELIGSHYAISSSEEILRLDGVTYGIPFSHETILAQPLNAQINHRSRILITGPSGCGKSSLLRVIAGLWPCKSGHVFTNKSFNRILFLPQRSYFTNGRLIDQFTLPRQNSSMLTAGPNLGDSGHLRSVEDAGDSEQVLVSPVERGGGAHISGRDPEALVRGETSRRLEELIDHFELRSVVDRLGGLFGPARNDWSEILSPGEQQRVSLARVCYHTPDLVILDESTSQLSCEAEELAYSRLIELNIAIISVGHRPSLEPFHTQKLSLDGRGSWVISNIIT